MNNNRNPVNHVHIIMLGVLVLAYILAAINPLSRMAWLGQMTPAVLAVALLVGTYRQFRFTTFVYIMVFLHVLLLLYGAHYTYSHNPLFELLQERFGWARNYFDRVGHFAQGLVPALVAKEFLLRGGYVKKSKILPLIVVLSCLGFSAAYELSEFAAAKIVGVPPEVVMGTQGDAFDSLWDMFWALIGASTAVFVFGPCHASQMAKMGDGSRLSD